MVTSIATQKGGTGKTTTSISLAAGLAHAGKRVLLVDVDPQANSSKVLVNDYLKLPVEQTAYATIIDRRPLPIHPSNIPNLDISPAHILMSDTDIVLATVRDHREARLKSKLDLVKARYDFVFIDCPPNLGWLPLNAFTASDEIIVVVEPGYFELDSIVQITKTVREVQEMFNPDVKIRGFLFTKSDPTINTRVSLDTLRMTYSEYVFETIIPRNVDIKDALFQRKDIFSYNAHAKSALAYRKLIHEIYAV